MPEKLTIDHEVELTRLQVQLSKDYLDSDASKKLLNEIDINGIGRSQTHIFAMLSKLRSICNHPVLVTEDWSMAHVKAEDSAKGSWEISVAGRWRQACRPPGSATTGN